MAVADLVLRARLNYDSVEEETGWKHLMINDYLGITQVEDVFADQIDINTLNIEANTAAILINSADIATNAAAIIVNASDILVNAAAILVNLNNIEDVTQLVGALMIQNGKLQAEILSNRSIMNDNSQLAGRV